MKIRYTTCPACSATAKVEDDHSGKFTCPQCGYIGHDKQKVDLTLSTYEAEKGLMQGLRYTVDIVMVIDATASMRHIIDEVKSNALRFYDDLRRIMEVKSKMIDNLRVKVIAFRDYYADGKDSMVLSPFYNLPEDREKFNRFVSDLRATGGGNLPENGLEAIDYALRSDWTTLGDKKRHVIVLWTDASSHPLEMDANAKPRGYPATMSKNLNELTDMWESHKILSPSSKRLILYAPEKYAWNEISANWSNTIQYPSIAGAGLTELDYQTILDAIANSV